jgi:ribonuclease D
VEWKFDRRSPGKEYFTLQENISLIQVASESEVGLFHIGLHNGNTVAEVLAPSLRRIIETDSITKTGVAILSADGARLKKYMNLQPKGLFELSHMYRLVKYSTTNPDQCTRKLVGLAAQVQEHLGFPLSKGDVRTSDWSKALNEKQIAYAASDAYCGFVLYHVLDAKRCNLVPTPPRPDFAERWTPIRLAEPVVVVEEDDDDADNDNEGSSSEGLLPTSGRKSSSSKTAAIIPSMATSSKKPAPELDDLDALGKTIFDALCEHRKKIAARDGVKLYLIASNSVLANVAKVRPQNLDDLATVKGVGPFKVKNYGEGWLKVVSTHLNVPSPVATVPQARNDSFLSTTEEPAPRRKRPEFKVPPPLPEMATELGRPTTPEPLLTVPSVDRQATLHRSVSAPQRSFSPSAFEPLPSTPTLSKPQSCDSSPQVDPSFRRLYSALSALRLRLSTSTGKALHDISSDDTLKALASRQPTTIGEIVRVPFAGKLLQTARSKDIDLLKFLNTQYESASFRQNLQFSPNPTTSKDNGSPVARSHSFEGNLAAIQDPKISPGSHYPNLSPRVRNPQFSISETQLSNTGNLDSHFTPQSSNKKQRIEPPTTPAVNEDLASYFDENINWSDISDG